MLFAKTDPYAKMINEAGYLCPDLEWRIDLINIQLTLCPFLFNYKRALVFGVNTKESRAGYLGNRNGEYIENIKKLSHRGRQSPERACLIPILHGPTISAVSLSAYRYLELSMVTCL